jgi:hypothetical protein
MIEEEVTYRVFCDECTELLVVTGDRDEAIEIEEQHMEIFH